MTEPNGSNSLSRILNWKWIYVILIGSFFFILINPIPFPVEINRWTQAYYDYVESIPSGSLVIMSPDFVAAGYQENGYAGEGMLKQFWRNDLDVIIVGFQPESTQMAEKMVSRISDYIAANNVVYGEDYVLLPMVSGLEVGAASLALEGKSMFDADHYGTPISQLPIVQRFNNYADVSFCVGMGGRATAGYFINHWHIPFGTKVGSAAAALGLAGSVANFDQGWTVGAVVGLVGTTEYELLNMEYTVATKLTGTLNMAVLILLIGVILANVVYFMTKSNKGGE
jgi:hypothetical protein